MLNFIILNMDGGFASQLSKYMFGLFLEKHFLTTVKYDLSWFEKEAVSIDGKDSRKFELLNVYKDLDFKIASKEEIEFFKRNYYYTNVRHHWEIAYDLLGKKAPLYVDGYYYHWQYFEAIKNIAIQNLVFKLPLNDYTENINQKIQSTPCSIACHIRRGDFVNSDHDILTPAYFINSIKYLFEKESKNDPVFYLFSNGIDYVKEKILPSLPENLKYIIVDGNNNDNGYYDFFLISQCKHTICANSGFGYVTSFLKNSKESITIIPDLWMKGISGEPQRHPDYLVMKTNGSEIWKQIYNTWDGLKND